MKNVKSGVLVRLKTGEIVRIEREVTTTQQGLRAITKTYETVTETGERKTITIDEIIEVLGLLQKLWLIVKGIFGK